MIFMDSRQTELYKISIKHIAMAQLFSLSNEKILLMKKHTEF